MTWSQLYDYMMCVLWYDLVTVIWLHDVSYDMNWSQLYDYMMCPMIWPGHSYMTTWCFLWYVLVTVMTTWCVLWYDLVTVIWLHNVSYDMTWSQLYDSIMCPMIWPGHSYMTTWCVSYDTTWSQLYDYMMCPMIWPGHSYMTTWCVLWYDLVTVIWLHDVSCDMTWSQLYDYMMWIGHIM
jgi:hypothetical protein